MKKYELEMLQKILISEIFYELEFFRGLDFQILQF